MTTEIFIDPKFHYHPKYKVIYDKVRVAIKKFPEIKYVVLSAFFPKDKEDLNSAVNVIGYKMNFNIKIVPTYNTLYHELWHVVQDTTKETSKSLVKLEREATLLGLARMPKTHIETNLLPYIGTVPKSKILYYTDYATKLKKKGDLQYIEKTVKLIEQDRKRSTTRKSKSALALWVPDKHDDKKLKLSLQKDSKNTYAKGHTPKNIIKFLKTQVKTLPTGDIFQTSNNKIWVYSKKDLKLNNWMNDRLTLKQKPNK